MAGCLAQPVRARHDRPLALAIALSVGVHLLGGIVTTRVGIEPELPGRTSSHDRWLRSGAMNLAFDEQEAPSDPRRDAETAAAPQQPPTTEPPTPAPQPEPMELTLGIDGSTHKTDNMIGFREATEHSARKSEVDQPALELDAGSMEAATRAAGQPDAKSAEPTQQPSPREAMGPPEPTLAQLAAAAVEASAGPKGDALETREAVPAQSEPAGNTANNTPGAAIRERPPVDRPIADRTREFQAATTQGTPDGADGTDRTTVIGANPPAGGNPSSGGKPGDGGNAPSTNPASADEPGNAPGIKSDKESDPSSRIKPIEVRFGQTVAGDGVEIVTRRPRQPLFTKLTRVTVAPDNPGVEATFDASGKVVDVKLVKSSGYADVDEPVINMVYSWRARGPKLAALTAGDPTKKFKLRFLVLIR
ncbi:MAG: hypothetical protein IT438_12935 [Phycisphaerales bacterium]|nr:hypothetical protein [Phycisphaerales bacterium]